MNNAPFLNIMNDEYELRIINDELRGRNSQLLIHNS